MKIKTFEDLRKIIQQMTPEQKKQRPRFSTEKINLRDAEFVHYWVIEKIELNFLDDLVFCVGD